MTHRYCWGGSHVDFRFPKQQCKTVSQIQTALQGLALILLHGVCACYSTLTLPYRALLWVVAGGGWPKDPRSPFQPTWSHIPACQTPPVLTASLLQQERGPHTAPPGDTQLPFLPHYDMFFHAKPTILSHLVWISCHWNGNCNPRTFLPCEARQPHASEGAVNCLLAFFLIKSALFIPVNDVHE